MVSHHGPPAPAMQAFPARQARACLVARTQPVRVHRRSQARVNAEWSKPMR